MYLFDGNYYYSSNDLFLRVYLSIFLPMVAFIDLNPAGKQLKDAPNNMFFLSIHVYLVAL